MSEEAPEAASFEANVSRMLARLYTPAWVGGRKEEVADNKRKSKAATFSDNVNKVFLDMYLPPFLRDEPEGEDEASLLPKGFSIPSTSPKIAQDCTEAVEDEPC